MRCSEGDQEEQRSCYLEQDAQKLAEQIGELLSAQAKLERLVDLVSDIPSRLDDLTLVVLQRSEELIP